PARAATERARHLLLRRSQGARAAVRRGGRRYAAVRLQRWPAARVRRRANTPAAQGHNAGPTHRRARDVRVCGRPPPGRRTRRRFGLPVAEFGVAVAEAGRTRVAALARWPAGRVGAALMARRGSRSAAPASRGERQNASGWPKLEASSGRTRLQFT